VSGQIHLPCRFTPTEGVLDAEYIWGWVDLRADLEAVEEINFALPEIESGL
jgi:hypothetical protein